MLDASLEHLRCPSCAQGAGSSDAGRLEWLVDGPVPIQRSGGDVQEGLLACADCAASYPVLAGLALLVPSPRAYLARVYPSLLASALEHASLSPAAVRFLGSLHVDLPPLHAPDLGRGNAGLYLDEASAEPGENGVPIEPPLAALLEHAGRRGHLPRLLAMLDAAGGRRGLAIDAGCHAGVHARELAGRYDRVYAFDLSFHAALLARRSLLGRPSPLEHFTRYGTLRTAESRRLAVTPVDNVEVLVANLLVPPFAASCADAVLCANVLDEIGGIEAFVLGLRGLPAPGGRLALSTSYSSPGLVTSPPGRFGPEALRRELQQNGITVLAEQDGVPRVLRNYDRSYSVFLCHCLIGETGDPT